MAKMMAGMLQKKQKKRGDTFQTSYWLHPRHLLPLPKKGRTSQYVQCAKYPLIVKHILLNCDSFKQTHPKY